VPAPGASRALYLQLSHWHDDSLKRLRQMSEKVFSGPKFLKLRRSPRSDFCLSTESCEENGKKQGATAGSASLVSIGAPLLNGFGAKSTRLTHAIAAREGVISYAYYWNMLENNYLFLMPITVIYFCHNYGVLC
jgi:hypothetical protein